MSQVVRKVVGEELIKLLPQAHVSGVEVSDDLRHATVWLDTLTPEDYTLVRERIGELRPQLARAVARYTTSKFTPKLNFRFDEGAQHADQVDQLLARIKKR